MRVCASLFLAAAFFAPRAAAAFVCATVPNSAPVLTQVWTQRCVPYWVDGFSTRLLQDNTLELIQESFEVWTEPECTDLTFVNAGFTFERVGFDADSDDNRNVVLATRSNAEALQIMEDPDLLAITITAFSTETGELLDADIVINGAQFLFEDVATREECIAEGVAKFDLRNTMVHEVGHFIGFDHDGDVASTMFAEAEPCEIKKRDLAMTDLDGLCQVYPAGEPAATCNPPAGGYGNSRFLRQFRDQCDLSDDCGCTSTEQAQKTPGLPVVMLVVLWWLRRRYRPGHGLSGR